MKLKLSEISPSDKPWNVHKAESLHVAHIYLEEEKHFKKAVRMFFCSGVLDFGEIINKETGEAKLHLMRARFCRVRYCPICQWRRSLFWRARFFQALPQILQTQKAVRFLFLTLTVRNCSVEDLRSTIQTMNRAWQRLIKRKEFRLVKGWVRTTEVTRRAKDNTAHPHFHCLLMVSSSYFKGDCYVSQKRWSEIWQETLKTDYAPRVDIRAVKAKGKREIAVDDVPRDGIIETLKYSVKAKDMIENPEWFLAMTEQTHKLRFIATGGEFKNIFKREEQVTDEDMIYLAEETPNLDMVQKIMRFLWSDSHLSYMTES